MASKDPEIRAHREWIGFLQEDSAGLVVSPPALVKGQAIAPRGSVELQRRFLAALAPPRPDEDDDEDEDDERDEASPRRRASKRRRASREREPVRLRDFPRFAREFLDWEFEDLVGGPSREERAALPKSLVVALPEYQQVLAPTWAVPNPAAPKKKGKKKANKKKSSKSKRGEPEQSPWLMLILAVDGDLDDPDSDDLGAKKSSKRAKKKARERGWRASPQIRFERLLDDTGVSIGLLVNERAIRLVYAPPKESSGYLTFPLEAMSRPDGRAILGAFDMLLGSERLFTLPDDRRLPALLAESRKYQSEVSNQLAEQVLRALGELLRGFVAADDVEGGALLGDTFESEPQQIYGGLITTLMRLVFLLYAEERGLMPQGGPYTEHYAVTSLFEQLRADAGLYPDTMDQRYGAWARLLSLFRLVHDGGSHGAMRLPERRGKLFNPDTYAFLEGRPYGSVRNLLETITPPRVSDGVIYRVLEDLLILDGERLSYRSLDVEQIGSVYEAIMGFEIRRAKGRSIAVRPDHVVVDLEELVALKPAQRAKLLDKQASCKLTGKALKELKAASTVDELVAALGRRISPQTPTPLAEGALYLQPTEERRRSGSHYTPRSLTEPIVETTLQPVLEALGERPTPEQILGLKICDPAMGSGAFLVATCRYLAKALQDAWAAHDATPTKIPVDETVDLHARRLVAQRCLYGVDRNGFAVDLAKLSLWLETLAKDHAFSFIDHALRHGDSLVGLTRQQIAAFHWQDDADLPLFRWVAEQVTAAKGARDDILKLGDEDEAMKHERWRDAEASLEQARLIGDLVISAFFAEKKTKQRVERLGALRNKVDLWKQTGEGGKQLKAIVEEMREATPPLVPLHWEIEFPEVFDRYNPGFDAFVGNPPFGGKNTINAANAEGYIDWLKGLHEGVSGTADLVAHFFRRVFSMLRKGGAFGLIATNTISQGDTRSTGLRWICTHGGRIYNATKRYRWPDGAAVIVSVVHVQKGEEPGTCVLDNQYVDKITAFLFHAGGHEDPVRLSANVDNSFIGSYVLGKGFTFDDSKSDATPIAEMLRLVQGSPRNAERILPYIGGREVNSSPTHAHHRHVIYFGELSEAKAREWPELMEIVEAKVKPERMQNKRAVRKKYWWRFGETTPALFAAIAECEHVFVASLVSKHLSFTRLPSKMVFSHKLVVFPEERMSFFAGLQSRPHEIWAWFLSSTMKDDLNYSPSDCFETFPFPNNPEAESTLEEIGERYYTYRAELMVKNDQGLTDTYNRFHDPNETDPAILKLRQLHDEMDRAVLAAYGWDDLELTCEFLLDYEDEDDGSGKSSRKKKPWRYRWPDALQEEVLARLLELNQQRAEEERLAGLHAGKGKKKAKRKTKKKTAKTKRTSAKKKTAKKRSKASSKSKADPPAQPDLFSSD